MSDTPWTPGPWLVFNRHYVNDHDGEPVATVDISHPDLSLATARLIAAAPEMAELLTECITPRTYLSGPNAASIEIQDAFRRGQLIQRIDSVLSRIWGEA